jgi:hypothetical protein
MLFAISALEIDASSRGLVINSLTTNGIETQTIIPTIILESGK